MKSDHMTGVLVQCTFANTPIVSPDKKKPGVELFGVTFMVAPGEQIPAGDKQRRFSRDVATDVDWILNQGRTLGVRALLRHKLHYLWRSCTGELSEQNDLFRLTRALELAKQYDWVYHVLSDSEWSGRRQIQPSAAVNSICLLKSCGWEAVSNDYWKRVTISAS